MYMKYFTYTNKMDWRKFVPEYDYIMGPGHISQPYVPHSMQASTAYHWGQLKLIIAEIQFLTRYSDPAKGGDVVYVAAGPGEHIPDLIRMFPEYNYHLYADRFFGGLVSKSPEFEDIQGKFVLYLKYFNDDDAAAWRVISDTGRPVYFISDIRTGGDVKGKPGQRSGYQSSLDDEGNDQPDEAHEGAVLKDMETQAKWVEYIRPTMAHLKFRLPYPVSGKSIPDLEYFKGTVYVQQWPRPSTTECRLVVPRPQDDKDYPKQIWSLKNHEDGMFYHNLYIRQKVNYFNIVMNNVKEGVAPELGLSTKYDGTATSSIIRDYLLMRGYTNITQDQITTIFLKIIVDVDPVNKYTSIQKRIDAQSANHVRTEKAKEKAKLKGIGKIGSEQTYTSGTKPKTKR